MKQKNSCRNRHTVREFEIGKNIEVKCYGKTED